MGRQKGIRAKSYEKVVFGAGAVYKNYGIGVRTITLSSVIATDAVTVTIDTVATTFTFVSTGATGNEVNVGVSDAESASNLATAIGALTGVTAAASSNVVTVTGDNALINFSVTTTDTTMTIGTNGLNSELIGATNGGSEFVVAPEYTKLNFDGAPGDVEGDTVETAVDISLTANFMEISKDLLLLAIPGATAADYPTISPTHDEITKTLTVALSDYQENITILADVLGSSQPAICGIENAMANSGLQMSFAAKEGNVIAVTWKGSFDPADLDKVPFFIRYPKMS